MGEHINTKHNGSKRHKKGFYESADVGAQRARRVTFKAYVKDLEDDLLEQELSEKVWVLEGRDDVSDWIEIDTFASESEADAECERLEASGDSRQLRVREDN